MVHDRPESSRPDLHVARIAPAARTGGALAAEESARPLAERERERKLKAERSKRARALPRIQRDTAAEVTRLLNRAAKDVRSALAGGASDYQAWTLPRLQASVRAALHTLGTGAGETLSQGAARAWEAGVDTVERPLDDAFGLDEPGFRLPAAVCRRRDVPWIPQGAGGIGPECRLLRDSFPHADGAVPIPPHLRARRS